eukprot:CAMPEP_0178953402 /NCGR_PEP_ID=MMETSP0789-20121207/8397_1 /TAXON_ID=3005 /ORGANISM="Rhizosolenia setigera, Strain CCMP 1694" /LENGTH=217 /DNA_ID=CAMNT_0020634653 /DNA_START=134 /DNA_END=787 /DNA_ORIENTATION=+
MTKETYLYGYAPFAVIKDKIERAILVDDDDEEEKLFKRVGKGVVLYGRLDVMEWALGQRTNLLHKICEVAAEEGRLNILKEVWNNANNDDNNIFGGFVIKVSCAFRASEYGQLHILQWLKEEQGLKLFEDLYNYAVRGVQGNGGHLHVMKWLREIEVPWGECTFPCVACRGHLDILHWLHNEGCPWPEYYKFPVREEHLKPEVVEWLRVDGYSDRFM